VLILVSSAMVTVAITHVAAENQATFYSVALCVAEYVRTGWVILKFGTIIINMGGLQC